MLYRIEDVELSTDYGAGNNYHIAYGDYECQAFEASSDAEAVKIAEAYQAEGDKNLLALIMNEKGLTETEARNTEEYLKATNLTSCLVRLETTEDGEIVNLIPICDWDV